MTGALDRNWCCVSFARWRRHGALHAQDYRAVRIRIIVPPAPRGAIDTTARFACRSLAVLQARWCREQAGCVRLSAMIVARAPDYGYTLLPRELCPPRITA